MLHGLGKPRFYKKSKKSLKLLKTRLETIKKKKNAVLKFMKSDVAELLRDGIDINAYGRAEGLFIERKMATCYDIIEQCIGCILGQVSTMQKQKECPIECREAVPTLMYAAARFADLPELRDLRSLFTDRYGNSLDSYVNKEFVERLKSTPPTKEIKLQILHEIAHEFSIEWDSKALQQKLYTPPPPAQHNPWQGSFYNKEDDEPKHLKRKDDAYNLPSSSEVELGANFRRDSTSQDSQQTSSSSVDTVSDDEADSKKPFYYRFIPPPNLNSDPAKVKSTSDEPTKSNGNASAEDDKKPRFVRKNKLKPPPGQEVTVSAEMREKQARRRAESLLKDDDGEESDEEKRLDSLLMHYSKKKAPQEGSSTGANRRRHTSDNSELHIPPGRTSSVPKDTTIPSPKAAKKGIVRTKSLEGDKHVHPKLPDYDDLAARIAAIRGL